MSDPRDRPSKRRRERARQAQVRPLDDAAVFPEGGLPFARYHLLKRLSYGGMGEIFLAKHDGIGGFSKLLVIKRLLQHYRGDDDVVAMFFDEAKLQALMSDRHIVQIWDMGKVADQYFIAMEYVEGTSWRRLGERLQQRGERMHAAHAVDLVVQACRGLGYAHNLAGPDGQPLSLVHRDVNPQNVLVSFAGECKLIDFGIAKSEMSGHHTETGTIKGKFAYMSPEQARAEPLDRRSDIFSMGICLYEMLSGSNPFHRKNVVLSLEAICEQAAPALEDVRPDAAALSPVVERCLAKNPDERFASCAELEDALVSLYLDGLFGEPPESLSELLQRLFEEDIEEQSAFLRQRGFSSSTLSRGGASSDTGSLSPFGASGDVTKRALVRRSQTGSAPAHLNTSSEPSGERTRAERSRSERSSQGRRGAGRSNGGTASGESPDTHPTATLALASLPSRSLAPSADGSLPFASAESVPSAEGAFAEDTEVPEGAAQAGAPRSAGRMAARLALLVVVALLLAVAGGLVLLASSDASTLDVLLAKLSASGDDPAADAPREAKAPDAGPTLLLALPGDDVMAPAPDAGHATQQASPDAGHAAQQAPDAGPAREQAPDAGHAGEPPAAREEPDVAAADDPPPDKRQPDRRKTSKRASSRAQRGDRVQRQPAKTEEPAAPEAERVGVLTLNAGGPFTIQGKGVRRRNIAKLPLLAGEDRTLTVSGGALTVKLRVSAADGVVDVRVDTEPWAIVRANNIGRGRTPQALRVLAGEPVQLVLKHPEAGEMKVTLGFSRTTR